MHDRDHEVGPLAAPGAGDVQTNLLALAPGDSWFVVIGFKTVREKLVVSQEGNSQAIAFNDQRCVRLCKGLTPAKQPISCLSNQSSISLKAIGPKSPE